MTFLSSSLTCPARQSGLHQLTFERSRAGSHLDAEKSFSPPGRKLFSASKCDPARLRSNVSWWRPDCLAGHVRLELRNVVANYPFERSHRFPVIEPNSGRRD